MSVIRLTKRTWKREKNTDRNKIVLREVLKKSGRDQPCMGENGILTVSTIGRQKLDTNSRENTKIN